MTMNQIKQKSGGGIKGFLSSVAFASCTLAGFANVATWQGGGYILGKPR